MPTLVRVRDLGGKVVSFPDGMGPEEISAALAEAVPQEVAKTISPFMRQMGKESGIQVSPLATDEARASQQATVQAQQQQAQSDRAVREVTMGGKPLASKPTPVAFGDPVSDAGQVLGKAGQLAGAAVADTIEAGTRLARPASYADVPTGRNLAAVAKGQPMPTEQELAQAGGWTELLGQPIISVARMAPMMAASGAAMAAGAPAAAAVGAPMALKPEGDVDLAGGLIAAAIPAVSKFGRDLTGKAVAKAIGETKVVYQQALEDPAPFFSHVESRLSEVPGMKVLARDTVVKGIEAMGAGAMTTAYLMAASAPEIMSLPVGEREQAAKKAFIENMAMAMLGLPEVLNGLPPETLKHLKITPDVRRMKGANVGPADEQQWEPARQLPATGSEISPGAESKPSAPAAPAAMVTARPVQMEVSNETVPQAQGLQEIAQASAAGQGVPAAGVSSTEDSSAVAAPEGEAQLMSNPPRPVPAEQIATRPDLMQFKRSDDTRTGTNEADKITSAKWDENKAGNLLLWEPLNPEQYGLTPGKKYIVANGHHRFEYGTKQGVRGYSSQIVREADGISASEARALGAELNIADGKGTIYDQAKFIRDIEATHGADAALERARQIGARGRDATAIGLMASPDTFTSFINEQITPDQAKAIATTAPGNEDLQRWGIKQAVKGESAQDIANFMRAVQAGAGAGATEQLDMFGASETAIATAEAMAKRASGFQRAISEQIRAVQGAARRPEQAAALGVNVLDPQGVLKRIAQLKAELERWNNWPLHPDLVAAVRSGDKPKAPAVAELPPIQTQPELLTSTATPPESNGLPKAPTSGQPLAPQANIPQEFTLADARDTVGQLDAELGVADHPEAGGYSQAEPVTYEIHAAGGREGRLPATFGGMEYVRPIEMPELVRWWEEMSGKVPLIKRLPRARGLFHARAGAFDIVLDPAIFANPQAATMTLAHEIGHGIDFLPEQTMGRGNIFGRIGSMRGWLSTTFPLNTSIPLDRVLNEADRRRLRTQAQNELGVGEPPTDPVELAAWREAVSERYQELIDEECERRGLARIAQVTAEVRELSEWWKPIPAGASEWFIQYRHSSVELYADALSVLFNSPDQLADRAPTFWRMFWSWLERKPEVRGEFFAIQNLLFSGQRNVLQEREGDIEAKFVEGEELLKRKAAEREARRNRWDGYWLHIKQVFYDYRAAAFDKAYEVERGGRTVDPAYDPRKFLEEEFMSDNTASQFIKRMFEGVIKPLEDAGISTNQLGRYLFYRRILADRTQMANPGGHDPLAARKALLKMRLDLGINRMTLLEFHARRFHELAFEKTREAFEAGAINAQVFADIVEPNKYSYATFAVLDYLEEHIPAGIKAQIGTFKDIANPFTATLLKAISMIKLTAHQRAKRSMLQLLANHFPSEFQLAKTRRVGLHDEPVPHPDWGLLSLLENGRMRHYYVDKEIAYAFEHHTPGRIEQILKPLTLVFSKSFYPMWITYNAAFQVANAKRDFSRTKRNLRAIGGPGAIGLLGAYSRAMGPAIRRLRGLNDPLITEMVENFALDPAEAQANWGRDPRGDYLQVLLERYRLAPEVEGGKLGQAVDTVLRPLRFSGNLVESLSKIASYQLLTDQMHLAPRSAAVHVRNNAGTPNTRRHGSAVYVIKPLIPFWNVFIQGYGADLKMATGKGTRSRWWWNWAMNDGFITMLMGMATAGALGVGIKKLMDGVSDYNKTNYHIIPLGSVPGGDFGSQTVFLRIPRDETSRLLSGLMYKVLTKGQDGVSSAFAFGAGQVPTENPAINIASKWIETYAFNMNPVDTFRGRPIIDRDSYQAGGIDKAKPLMLWTYNQTGLQDFVRLDESRKNAAQWTLNMTPVVHRFIGITDYGYREQQKDEVAAELTVPRAEHRLALPSNVRSLSAELYTLQQIGEKRTPEQSRRYQVLQSWRSNVYRPFDEAIRKAEKQKNEAKSKQLRENLGQKSERFVK